MDAKRLKFLMDVQEKIDELERKIPPNDIPFKEIKERFYRLSQNELKGEKDFNTEKIVAISSDTKVIRQALFIKGEISIDFDFINSNRVKNQLVIDNLRMENVRLNLEMPDLERFHEYCVNAFYQIEELINYFYWKKNEGIDIKILLDFIEEQHNQRNKAEDNKTKPFYINFRKEETKQTDVSKIDIYNKLTAFMYYFQFSIEQNILINNIRQLRNENSHRCTAISNNIKERLYKFVNTRDDNYDNIRRLISYISMIIKKEFEKM